MSEGEEALGPAKPIRPDEPDEEPPIEDKRLRVGKNVAFARRMLRTANAVLFDVDSTVIQGEGIDELAAYLGVGADVAAITARAMGGNLSFHEALVARLDIMQPSKEILRDFLSENRPRLTPGVAKFISTLQQLEKEVYLVSGGFRQMLDPIAAMIGLSRDKIYANTLLFDEVGNYAGHDQEEPTAYTGGKAIIAQQLRSRYEYKTIVMIGDGATDMEAAAVGGGADAFIGFGGNKVRPLVKEGADWFVLSFAELIHSLEDHGPGEILDDAVQNMNDSIFRGWEKIIQKWWLVSPFKDGFLKGCMGALGLHLASRYEDAASRHAAALGGVFGGGAVFGGPPPPPPIANAADPACEWITDGSTDVQLPEVPEFPREFRLPPLVPIPRLLPGGSIRDGFGSAGGVWQVRVAADSRRDARGDAEGDAGRGRGAVQRDRWSAPRIEPLAEARGRHALKAATGGVLLGLVSGLLVFGVLMRPWRPWRRDLKREGVGRRSR